MGMAEPGRTGRGRGRGGLGLVEELRGHRSGERGGPGQEGEAEAGREDPNQGG